MAIKISQLPAAITSTVGDLFTMVQAGVTRKVTLAQIASFFTTPLAAPGGSATVGYQSPDIGAVLQTQEDKNNDVLSLSSYVTLGNRNGLTDVTTKVQQWLTALSVTGAQGISPQGIYLIGGMLNITSDVNARMAGSNELGTKGTQFKLAPGFSDPAFLKIAEASSNAIVRLGGFSIDFNGNTGVDGIWTTLIGDSSEFFDITGGKVGNAGRYGFFFDSTADTRQLDVLLRNCRMRSMQVGYRFVGKNPQTTSFDCFTMLNCRDASSVRGIYMEGYINVGHASGVGGNRVTVIGGDYENESSACIEANGATIQLVGAYTEPAAGGRFGRVSNFGLIKADAASSFLVGGESTNPTFWYTDRDATSTIITDAFRSSGAHRRAYIGPTDGAVRFAVTGAAIDKWGPPNYPLTKTGNVSELGDEWMDMQGVLWTCTKAGTSGGTVKSRWCALGGIIKIPIDFTMANGTRLLNVQGDFRVDEITFEVTTTYLGGTYFNIGNAVTPNLFISQEQGAVANLVAGARLSSRDNMRPEALLSAPFRNSYIIKASEYNVSDNTAIASYVSGTFTAGSGVLVVRGRYLTDENGTPYFGTTLSIVSVFPRQVFVAAVPAAGAWTRGDRAVNNLPTVGQPKAWSCTVSGTPGTWVSEGNL